MNIKTLIDAETIAAKVSELGKAIAADAQNDLVIVPVLKGSFIFAADLVRAIDAPLSIDFLGCRSYGDGTESSGVVQITYDLTKPIEGKDVVLVEDIVDTGLTMSYLLENLSTRKPRSLKLCSLLHKPARAKVQIPIDYLGFTIEDVFVIGYGLDFAEKHRNLPYIGVMEP
jgi:hypoxanthine phosphoribosyltransferase